MNLPIAFLSPLCSAGLAGILPPHGARCQDGAGPRPWPSHDVDICSSQAYSPSQGGGFRWRSHLGARGGFSGHGDFGGPRR